MKLNLKQPALSQNSKYSLFLLGSVLCCFILVLLFAVTPSVSGEPEE
jgi:hypothetical protein